MVKIGDFITNVCPKCQQPVGDDIYEHQLQDGWDCVGLGPVTSPKSDNHLNEGERRILNAIGHVNATNSVLWYLQKIREDIAKRPAPSAPSIDLVMLSQLLEKTAEERDAALAEVEFLKIKVEEMQARNNRESCQNGNEAAR